MKRIAVILTVWLLVTEHIPVKWGVPNLKPFLEYSEQECVERKEKELTVFGVTVRIDCIDVPEDARIIFNPETGDITVERPTT